MDFSIGTAATFLGVKINTLYVWGYRQKIKPARRALDNKAYYTLPDLKKLSAQIKIRKDLNAVFFKPRR